MILILTAPDDLHADRVESILRRRDAACFRFDPAEFPSASAISVRASADGRFACRLETERGDVDLTETDVIWYRRPGTPSAGDRVRDPLTRRAVAEESEVVLEDVWSSLGCRWVPGPRAALGHLKLTHLRAAAAIGFELPPTLLTTDPDAFLDFYNEHRGWLVSKRAGHSFLNTRESPFVRYTEVVSPREVGYARAVRHAPIVFQGYVPKRVELRVTVVGARVFAGEIDSQASEHARHDWRRYDHTTVRHRAHDLPDEVAGRCADLVRGLGLCFGAIDLIVTPDGRYVFVELNANGQYLWIEHATGLPISEAVADLLVGSPTSERPRTPPTLAAP